MIVMTYINSDNIKKDLCIKCGSKYIDNKGYKEIFHSRHYGKCERCSFIEYLQCTLIIGIPLLVMIVSIVLDKYGIIHSM